MNTLSDTSPEAERVLLDVYRKMPLGQRWRLLGDMWRTGRALHAAGVRLRNPEATDRDILLDWLEVNYGFRPPGPMRGPVMDISSQDLQAVQEVAKILEGLGIAYALGGSMASSIYGISRQTRDADITVEPFPGKEAQLAASFDPDSYYLSLPAVQEAVRDRSSFNLISTRTGFKVDVFVRKDLPFEQSAMRRRRALAVPALADPVVVHSPEDLVLFKLRWYRLGNESSEQQWKDVLGVLKIQSGKLDQAYLDQWAEELGVEDLLARARKDSEA